MKFLSIGQQIGRLVEEKNAAYGSSFAKAGAALRLLYPNGISPKQMDDALLIARIWDKLQRIATDRDSLGESPYRDIAGYGILGVAMQDIKRKQPVGGARVAHNKVRLSVSEARVRKTHTQQSTVLQHGVPQRNVEKNASRKEKGSVSLLRQVSSKKNRSASKTIKP